MIKGMLLLNRNLTTYVTAVCDKVTRIKVESYVHTTTKWIATIAMIVTGTYIQ
jgi:hypothetical protein